HGPASRHRRSTPRRSRQRGAGAGGGRQRADHLFLSQVVEHSASRRDGKPDHGAEDGRGNAHRNAGDGVRGLVLLDRHGAHAGESDHSGTGKAHQLGRRRGETEGAMSLGDFLSMGGYGFYVWGSYLMTGLALAVEIIAVRSRLKAAREQSGDATR